VFRKCRADTTVRTFYYYHYLVVVAVPFKCMNRARWVLIFVCVAWIW
jgi:hypothetical protein